MEHAKNLAHDLKSCYYKGKNQAFILPFLIWNGFQSDQIDDQLSLYRTILVNQWKSGKIIISICET